MKKKNTHTLLEDEHSNLENNFSLSTDICVSIPTPMPGEVHPLASPGLLFFKKAQFKSNKTEQGSKTKIPDLT